VQIIVHVYMKRGNANHFLGRAFSSKRESIMVFLNEIELL
jgi:hypothetical protein